jgi:hypothetical protein
MRGIGSLLKESTHSLVLGVVVEVFAAAVAVGVGRHDDEGDEGEDRPDRAQEQPRPRRRAVHLPPLHHRPHPPAPGGATIDGGGRFRPVGRQGI